MDPADPDTLRKTSASEHATPLPRRVTGRGLERLARRAEELLARRVVGQPEAVRSVAHAVRRAAVGLNAPRGPLATLLFVGPTGTGKTELARALAESLGGSERLVRIDCSEFGGKHESSKLIGAPPGYVGHERGGVLTRLLALEGECVVLFDEVEKAHSQLHELLLQVLDEGRLTDGRGRVLDFRRAFVILTSNLGTREALEAKELLGFPRGAPQADAGREIVSLALKDAFAPEFLARLDEVVLFRELTADDLRLVARKALLDLAVRVRPRGRRVCFSGAVERWAVGQAATSRAGARSLLHVVRREIEAPLAEALLASERGAWIDVSIRRGRPHFARST